MYDRDFYAQQNACSLEAGEAVLPWLLERTGARSVIDVGCGTGAWVALAQTEGCSAVGVDRGVPADLRTAHFIDWDLAENGFPCVGYDLAVCLEVAEHLPEEAGPGLVAGLTKAKAVLFSAAVPGQPGTNHVNCQPYVYWHWLFAECGYRPEQVGARFPAIARFYQRNMFLYEPE